MSKVTAIIPNYNHERFLPQRIESVLGQTHADLEVLLLDDASTDGSRQVFERYARHPRVAGVMINERNTGIPFKQWNKGVAAARGDYLWFAESDDFAAPTLVERLVALLDANPGVGVAYTQSLGVDENNEPLYSLERWTADLDATHWSRDFINSGAAECANYLLRRCTIPNASAVLVRRSVYEAVGGADETFRLSGDWMMWAKLLLASDVAFVAEPLNYFRMHANTVRRHSSRGAIALLEAIRIFAYISARTTITPAMREDVRDRLMQRWVGELSQGRFHLGTNFGIYRRLREVDDRVLSRLLRRALRHVRKQAA
jgi:glycosyltransferase involved in cell wall biosynthesis